jgi:hypothetical protein
VRALCGLLVLMIGCVHPTQRTGPAMVLGDAPPSNACERRAWIELAAAKSVSSELEFVDGEGRAREAHGVALFDRDDHALNLRRTVTKLNEPSLQAPLDRYVEPVHARLRESAYWLLGGVAAMALGIGYAATGGNELEADHIAAMSAGLTLGLAGAIVAWVRMPSKSARMEADLRRTMFVSGENDLDAVARGTQRLRARVRQQCTE